MTWRDSEETRPEPKIYDLSEHFNTNNDLVLETAEEKIQSLSIIMSLEGKIEEHKKDIKKLRAKLKRAKT